MNWQIRSAEDVRIRRYCIDGQPFDPAVYPCECDVKDIVYALKGSDEKIKRTYFCQRLSRMAESIEVRS